jgi:putative spermidine/putrescine transport system permease protein
MSTISEERRPPLRARASAALYAHRRLKLALLILPPLGWLTVVYLIGLAALLVSAFWYLDPLSSEIVHSYSLRNFRQLWDTDVYRTIALRTIGMALAVTLTDAVLAFPLAYYMVRFASPRVRTLLVLAVLMPLWSSYLVRVYTWRLMLSNDGVLNWALEKIGLGAIDVSYSNYAVWITFSYIWLPFMVLPVYAALERIPGSFLEASGDLGARAFTTFRRVILPLALPGLAAGSIFTFSLTLGDYIVPNLVGNTQFIGSVIFINVGVANNVPFAAAYATVPVVVMIVYLVIVKRLGAFEAL